MTRNIALLRRGVDLVIEADARNAFQQENWITTAGHYPDEGMVELDCKTAGCYAGHLVMDEGYRYLIWITEQDDLHEDPYTQQCLTNDKGEVLAIEDDWIEDRITIAEHVRSRLGITEDEANALFHHSNTTQDLKFLVDRLCAGESINVLYDHRGVRRTQEGVK